MAPYTAAPTNDSLLLRTAGSVPTTIAQHTLLPAHHNRAAMVFPLLLARAADRIDGPVQSVVLYSVGSQPAHHRPRKSAPPWARQRVAGAELSAMLLVPYERTRSCR